MVRLKRLFKQLLPSVIALLVVVSCSTSAPAPQATSGSSSENCQMVPHDIGRTEVCGVPEAIAVLSPPLLDIMLSLGVQPIAYASVDLFTRRWFDHPAEQIPYLGENITNQPANLGSRDLPSQEKLLQMKPDLILGEDYQASNYADFSRIAPTLLFNTLGADQWQQLILPLAQVLGREAQAEQALADYHQLLDRTIAVLAPQTHQQTMLVLGFDETAANSFILERQDFTCRLLEKLGFEVINFDEGDARLSFSLEMLPQIETDRILVMATGSNTIENAKHQWHQHPILRSVPAFQAGKVYFMDYQLARIRGPIASQIFLSQFRDLLRAS